MPSSYVDSVPSIIKDIIELNPTSVIDIGPGWGKYGLMCREYLPGLTRLDAVEVSEGRRNPVIAAMQDHVYDTVMLGDVKFVKPDWSQYQVALFIDVIEHMQISVGVKLLHAAIEAGCTPIVSTPQIWVDQHDDNNPYETHVSLWDADTFQNKFTVVRDLSTIDSIIYRLGKRVV